MHGDELLGVALLSHIDCQGGTSPERANATPANGHGIAFLLAANTGVAAIIKMAANALIIVLFFIIFPKTTVQI